MRRHRRSSMAGFTLLEAIVAMALMASGLLALYAWLGTSTLGAERAAQRMAALADARAALALVETINPWDRPRGESRVGPLEIRWTSTPLTEPRPGLSRAGSPTLFDFVLYDVEVEVRRNGDTVERFTVRRAGWEAARNLESEEF